MRMKVFAIFENEISCVDMACVDKLAKVVFGVTYLLVLQDLFDRNLDGYGMKTKDSNETVRAFLTFIIKKNVDPRSFGFTREKTLLYSLKVLPKVKDYNAPLQ